MSKLVLLLIVVGYFAIAAFIASVIGDDGMSMFLGIVWPLTIAILVVIAPIIGAGWLGNKIHERWFK